MRNSWVIPLACWCSFFFCSRADHIPVYKAEKPLVIDGKLSESVWERAVQVDVIYKHAGKGGNKANEPAGYAKVAWDEHYLYLGYESYDTDIRAATLGEVGGKEESSRLSCSISLPCDVVEIFISMNEDPEHFWEIHHNALDNFSDIYIIVPDIDSPLGRSLKFGIRFIPGDDIDARRAEVNKNFKFASAVFLNPVKEKETGKISVSTVNNSEDTDGGWTGEIRLPWGGIGADLNCFDNKTRNWDMGGQIITMLHVIQNGSVLDKYAETCFHTSPTKPEDWFHKGYEHWRKFKLIDRRRPEKDSGRAPKP